MQGNKQAQLKFDTSYLNCFVQQKKDSPIKEVDSSSLSSDEDEVEQIKRNIEQLTLHEDDEYIKNTNPVFTPNVQTPRDNHPYNCKSSISSSIIMRLGTPPSLHWSYSSQQKPQNRSKNLCDLNLNLNIIQLVTDSSMVDSEKGTSHSVYEIQNANASFSNNKSNSSLGKQDLRPHAHNFYQYPQLQQQPLLQQQQQQQLQPQQFYEFDYSTQQNDYQQQQYYQSLPQPITPFQQFQFHQQIMRKGRRKFEPQKEVNQFVINTSNIINDGRTTLMIKNIPNKYTQPLLLQKIDKNHPDTYDFFYLPIDFTNKCNVGYAFINFAECKFIEAFYLEFHEKKWDMFNSDKICQITYARIQGRVALTQHFQYSTIMNQKDRKMKPVFFQSETRNQLQQLIKQQKAQQNYQQ